MIVFKVESEANKDAWPSKGYLYSEGRWHREGMPVIYTAEVSSLAMIETLANSTFLPKNQCLMEIEINASVHIHEPDVKTFPKNWDKVPYPEENWDIMEALISEDHQCIKVPSVQAPGEYNYLLIDNIKKSEFTRLFKLISVIPLPFDVRLK